MTEIHLTTHIKGLAEICFDLSRSISVHKQSAMNTKERVVAGKTSGLMELNDTVTWEAVHFGRKMQLSVKMTELKSPIFFTDEMMKGIFKNMRHEHHFKPIENGTLMIDLFRYETPYGIFGRLFDRFFLKQHMTQFLKERNAFIKTVAESSSAWKQYLTL